MSCKFYNDDYKNIISSVPDSSIDLILTDPPYLFVKGGMKGKLNVGKMKSTSFMNKEMSDFGKKSIYEFLNLTIKKLKKVNYFIFCSKLQLPHYLNYAVENKLQFDVGIWDKMSGALKSKQFLKPCDYFVRIYGSGAGLQKCDENIFYEKVKRYKSPKGNFHEAEKPIDLLVDILIISSKEQDLIFDPFMGSGSLALACQKTKRNYIGVEQVEEIYKIAMQRILLTCP